MIDIWKYKDVDKARIVTTAGAVYEGVIISMVDKEDYEDIGADNANDTIDIENKDGIFSFRAFEVAAILSLDRESDMARAS